MKPDRIEGVPVIRILSMKKDCDHTRRALIMMSLLVRPSE